MKTNYSAIIEDMKQKGLYNEAKIVQSEQGSHLTIEGKEYLNLCSNNYLGLASHPDVKKSAKDAIEKYGVGTASVRALIGTNDLHIELEKKLAEFKHAEDAIVVTSGYLANLAAVQTILDKEDIVISDQLNHASIIDAVRVSGVQNKFIYAHNDMEDLKKLLTSLNEDGQGIAKKPKSNGEFPQILIITDGVFSMDGDIAPLPEIVALAEEFGAMVMVDDAHGEGVLGDHGRGIVDHFGLHGKVDIEVGTLSKAFGVLGGFITGKKDLISFYRQKARQFLFTNALSIPDTAALIAGVNIITNSDEAVKKLWKNTEYMRGKLKEMGLNTGNSQTPIIPIMIGDENKAKEWAKRLYGYGVMVTAIKFPMVALGSARIRLIMSATHSQKDLDFAVEMIKKVGDEVGLI